MRPRSDVTLPLNFRRLAWSNLAAQSGGRRRPRSRPRAVPRGDLARRPVRGCLCRLCPRRLLPMDPQLRCRPRRRRGAPKTLRRCGTSARAKPRIAASARGSRRGAVDRRRARRRDQVCAASRRARPERCRGARCARRDARLCRASQRSRRGGGDRPSARPQAACIRLTHRRPGAVPGRTV